MEEKSNSKKKGNSSLFALVGIGLVIVAVVLAILFLTRGETKITGDYPEPEASSALSCSATNYKYPFFENTGKKGNEIRINAIFKGQYLERVSLAYKINYDTAEEITQSEAHNHAAMNKSFANDGLGQDLFGSDYANLSDGLQYTIAANADDIYNYGGAKYFLLKDVGEPPYSLSTVQKAYTERGIRCEKK